MAPIEFAPLKPTISLDVLEQVDICVGTIEQVGNVAGSRSLVRLVVDSATTRGRSWLG